jgi:Transposase
MEVISPVKRRLFRSQPAILRLLREQRQSGLSIQKFCAQHSIPSGSFHNWKKKYGAGDGLSAGSSFAPVQIKASATLFAEVNGIKLYQPVSAGYLKELAS